MFFDTEEAKEKKLNFSQGTMLYVQNTLLQIYFALKQYQYKMTPYSSLNVKISTYNLTNQNQE